MSAAAFTVGAALALLALAVRIERRRYRKRTRIHDLRVVLVPYTTGECVGVAYSPEDSGEPRWT